MRVPPKSNLLKTIINAAIKYYREFWSKYNDEYVTTIYLLCAVHANDTSATREGRRALSLHMDRHRAAGLASDKSVVDAGVKVGGIVTAPKISFVKQINLDTFTRRLPWLFPTLISAKL
jgi:hypothetical protein